VVGKTENSEFLLILDGGRPQFYVHVGEDYTILRAEEPVPVDRWSHLAAVRDDAEVRLYVDGKLVARTAVEGPRTLNAMPIYVGAEPDAAGRPNRFFLGRIDEVRISSVARYSGEAFEPAVRHESDESTRLLLHLDVTRGPFTPDHSPSRASAASRGAVVYRAGGVEPGK
jgi:hypothetical protein